MEPIIYIIKVNLAIILFCLVYRAFYRKDTFFTVRRYLLQSILLLSAVYPLMDFSHWMMYSSTLTDMAMSYQQMLPEVVVYTSGSDVPATAMTAGGFISLASWLFLFYGVVTGLLLLRLVFRVLQICWIRLHSEPIRIEGKRVYKLLAEMSPFSFFSWIFIHPDMHNENELHEVLAHEMVHVRQHHSIDVVLSEIMTAFCWMNPMAWMIRKEMQKNLEFIVDSSVVNADDIDIKSYQYHLLKLASYPTKMTLANQFNISPLKERILMINGKKSPRVRLTAYTLILPFIVLIFVFNNMGMVAARINHSDRVKDVMARVSDIVSTELEDVKKGITKKENIKKEITGVILKKDTKEPLPGANIVVINATRGTITDVDGRFRLWVHEEDTLRVSFVGYAGFTLPVRNLSSDIGVLEMAQTQVALEEVKVVSYGRMTPSQQQRIRNVGTYTIEFDDESDDMVFVAVEKMPEFPGGENALLKFIADNLNYPVEAAKNGIQGRVACRFVVREDGTVGSVVVERPIDPSLDNEAKRILYSMPKWTPGEQRGKKVSVAYSIPITFRLTSGDMATL